MSKRRTSVGSMMDDRLAAAVRPALKRLHGALTQDLDATVNQFGGEAGDPVLDSIVRMAGARSNADR